LHQGPHFLFGFVGNKEALLSMGQPSKAVVFRRRKKKGKM